MYTVETEQMTFFGMYSIVCLTKVKDMGTRGTGSTHITGGKSIGAA